MASCTCEKPPALKLEEARLRALGGTFLGICGDVNHTSGFHLPACRVKSNDYSLRYGRGNPKWGAAIDVGMDFAHCRDWLVWLVAQARAGRMPGLCEIIGKPAGQPVLYWAEWHGWQAQRYTGAGHDTHTHLGCKRNYLANPSADLHLLDWTYQPAGVAPAPAWKEHDMILVKDNKSATVYLTNLNVRIPLEDPNGELYPLQKEHMPLAVTTPERLPLYGPLRTLDNLDV